jgi:hypothetical protein
VGFGIIIIQVLVLQSSLNFRSLWHRPVRFKCRDLDRSARLFAMNQERYRSESGPPDSIRLYRTATIANLITFEETIHG